MAVFAATDYKITINSVDLTDHCESATLNLSAAELSTNVFGTTWEQEIGGLKKGSLALKFRQDFAASSVDATLWAALGTVVTFDIRPTSGALSATNPKYTGSVLVAEYSPLDATVGDVAGVSVTFPTSGTVTRATS